MSTNLWVAISNEPDNFTITVHPNLDSALRGLAEAIPEDDWDRFANAQPGTPLQRTGTPTDVLTAWYGEPEPTTEPGHLRFGSGQDSFAEVFRRTVTAASGDSQ